MNLLIPYSQLVSPQIVNKVLIKMSGILNSRHDYYLIKFFNYCFKNFTNFIIMKIQIFQTRANVVQFRLIVKNITYFC